MVSSLVYNKGGHSLELQRYISNLKLLAEVLKLMCEHYIFIGYK